MLPGTGVKLTWKAVRDIRRRYAAGGVAMVDLGADYGVSSKTVWSIVHNKTWVEDEES